ncbi:DUF4158 domain-containing protein [Streptomyces sp. NPDC000941]
MTALITGSGHGIGAAIATNAATVEEQRRRFGHFTEDPDEGQLAGSFLLDQTARRRAMAARGPRNRIGWAVQLGTIRYLGTFLNNPEEVPAVVVAYVAEQLGLEPSAFAGYGGNEARWDHQEQIRDGYGCTKFEFDQWFALARWLYQRAWIGNERPTLLFDLATKRLVDKKVVLPGVTVLERLVSGTRERAEKRLWATLAAAPTPSRPSAFSSWSSSPWAGACPSWTGCAAPRATSPRAEWARPWSPTSRCAPSAATPGTWTRYRRAGSRPLCGSPRPPAPRPSPTCEETGAWPPWSRSPQ